MSEDNPYTKHAQYWDWSGHDRTQEHEYWLQYAAKYGRNVLIPMCAWGETGAYMAQRGFDVTAFDLTPEMITEGRERFGDIPGLRLFVADARDFSFDIPPADFCFSMDFEIFHTIEDVKRALHCIHRHLRPGGALVLEVSLPPKKSSGWPLETYQPFKQVYPNRKVWKTGSGHFDAKEGRQYISQTLYVEDANSRVENFDHSFYLQCYSLPEWRGVLKECGFRVTHEHRGREGLSWKGSGAPIIEAVKL